MNGADLAALGDRIKVSSNVASYLTNYSDSLHMVENGIYSAEFADAVAAFNATADWGVPTLGGGTVIDCAGFRLGYTFGDSSAVFYRFSTTAVPEPSTYGMMLGSLALAVVVTRRLRS